MEEFTTEIRLLKLKIEFVRLKVLGSNTKIKKKTPKVILLRLLFN